MAMDLAHSVGVSQVRGYADSDELIWVRWFKCQPGALPYPGTIWGGSPRWEEPPDEFTGPGIYLEPSEQRRPLVSPFPGTHAEGLPEWYQNGLPFAQRALPLDLCGVPMIAAQGGMALGGTGWGNTRYVVGSVSENSAAVGRASNPRWAVATVAAAESVGGSVALPRVVMGQAGEQSAVRGSVVVPRVVMGTARQSASAVGSTVLPRKVSAQATSAETSTGTAAAGGPVNPIITSCSDCPGGTYTYWFLTVSGITGGADCVAHNGSFRLTHQSGCTWYSDAEFSPGFPVWTLTSIGGGAWFLQAADSSFGTIGGWEVTSGWNCLASNTMPRVISSGGCSGWPLSITLTSS